MIHRYLARHDDSTLDLEALYLKRLLQNGQREREKKGGRREEIEEGERRKGGGRMVKDR